MKGLSVCRQPFFEFLFTLCSQFSWIFVIFIGQALKNFISIFFRFFLVVNLLLKEVSFYCYMYNRFCIIMCIIVDNIAYLFILMISL